MTYIEFYDRASVENIASCLAFMPDRLILIGAGDHVDARIRSYQTLFERRGRHVDIRSKFIRKTDLSVAIKQLTRLVEQDDDDIVFDITGGDELLVLALGMVCAAHPEKKIQIHKMNLYTGEVVDCDRDGKTVLSAPPRLSIAENVLIYGGEVRFNEDNHIDEGNTYQWELSEEFVKDVGAMWDLCRPKNRYWNMQISILESICGSAQKQPTMLTVSSPLDQVREALREKGIQYDKALDRSYIESLLRLGLLTAYDDSGENVTVSFKNPQVKKCLTIEGQVLELKMYIIAKNAVADEEPVYNDVLTGVKIDWDGVMHAESAKADVDNEIDVMMMHGVMPIFLSCKNGDLKPEELYKLHTVARRFGGAYSRMVLVAPSIDYLGDARLRERAEELGIIVLAGKDVLRASDQELTALLSCLWYS